MSPSDHEPTAQRTTERAALGGDVASQALNEALRVSFRFLTLAMILVAILFAASGVYMVKQHEQAFVLRFGKIVTHTDPRTGKEEAIVGPGIHFAWPFLIDEIVRFPVKRDLSMSLDNFWYVAPKNVPGTSLPGVLSPDRGGYNITGDANILHSQWTINYSVANPVELASRLADPADVAAAAPDGPISTLLRSLLSNAVISTMASFHVDAAYRGQREELKNLVAAGLVRQLEPLNVGITINRLTLDAIEPPLQAKSAFDQVTAAAQELDKRINEARGYYLTKTTQAVGEARQLVNEAEEYKSRLVNQAKADADYMDEILKQYPNDPRTLSLLLEQRRIEVLQDVLSEAEETFIVDLGTSEAPREVRIWVTRNPEAVRDVFRQRQKEEKERQEKERAKGR